MTEIRYIDKHGLFNLFPVSPSTIHRLTNREVDPFPAGRLIGGKRFRTVAETLEWLGRQDDSAPKKAAA